MTNIIVQRARGFMDYKIAKNIEELIEWIKQATTKQDLHLKHRQALNCNFYWSSFKTDSELNLVKNNLINNLPG